jgi:serine/threonine protein kinase
MEYVPGGDLGSLIQKERPLNEDAVKTMAGQLLGALGYLHRHNITHRDVKPDNILISSQQPFVVKLTDFGLSKMVDSEQTFLTTFCGTLLYCAPEVYTEFEEYDEFGHRNPRHRQRRPRGQRYDHAVDIWSLGGVLFYALTGYPPYPVKAGVSYTELLYQIMTQPLDITPLVRAGVSRVGIDFIRRMLNRRPEQRATVEMLECHPWLGGSGLAPRLTAGDSYDEISDDGLDQQASQLSLNDAHDYGDPIPDNLDDYYDENEHTGYESEKENLTFGAVNRGPPVLFGEVNVSAIGSSGVIPAERLNLPVSANSLATTDIVGEYEVRDSFDSEDTPKGKQQRSQPDSGPGLRVSVLSASQSRSVNDLNNMTFDVESQDLGGAESIMENLNMRSLAASHLASYDTNYFSTSKRKTSYENSEGSQSSVSHDRPTIKRFKSEALIDSMTDYSSDDDGEIELLAHIPPVARARSTRQMDEPVNKSTYWTAGDRKSYHLRYPEMTQFQLDAFRSAASARGEEFAPGKTPLWHLAMKYFPPSHYEQVVAKTPLDVETVSNASGDARAARPSRLREEQPSEEPPPTAGPTPSAEDHIPDTMVPTHNNIIVPVPNPPGKRIVASLQSTPISVIGNISLHLTESMLSWGRHPDNTRVFEPSKEVKVPKYAFKVMLWKSGYDPSRDFRPWNQKLEKGAEDAFHFYISTKSTRGIHVNDVFLPSHDSKVPSSPSRYWMRLHDGDVISVWTGDPAGKPSPPRTEVLFRCAWGGSSLPRSSSPVGGGGGDENTPPTSSTTSLVAEQVARKLDELCARAERRIPLNDEHDFKIAEAEIDRNERAADIGPERERSRLFEVRRVEACRALAARNSASRKGSPAFSARASPAPVGGSLRTVAVRGRGSPGTDS